MSHFFDAGFTVNEWSWHKLENHLTEYPGTLDEALPLGFPRRDGQPGHWEPMAEPVFVRHLVIIDGEPVEQYRELPGFQAIVRDDDGTPLSVPRDSYEIIGNRELAEIGVALLDQGAQFDTMFSVKDGAQVGMTLLLDEPVLVAGDDSPSAPFLNLNTGHDGATACRAGYAVVRQVCANTIAATNYMWDSGSMPSYTFKHTAGVKDRIAEAKVALQGARDAFAQFVRLSEELASIPCDDEMLQAFLEGMVPMPEQADAISERQRKNIMAARGTMRSLYEGSVTTEGVRDTALGLVHTAVEYLDHYRAHRSTESLVRRTLISDDGMKAAAIRLAFDACGRELPELLVGA
jgi:phage/plasmid-like protein (TIGR03299 family)